MEQVHCKDRDYMHVLRVVLQTSLLQACKVCLKEAQVLAKELLQPALNCCELN